MKNWFIIFITIAVLMLITGCSSQQEIQPVVSADAINTETAQTVEEAVQSETKPTASVAESITPAPSATDSTAEEDDVAYGWSLGDRAVTLDTIEEFNEISDFVITGVCLSSEPDYQDGFLYTVSEIKIDTVYRGENLASGDTIIVIEVGGRSTYGEYHKNVPKVEKAFYTGEPSPDDKKYVYGLDGHFPLKEGEQVLLFLGDSTGFIKSIEGPAYGIWGDYDGKLLLMPDGKTYANPLPSENDTIEFGEESFKITVDELKEKIGKEKPKAE